ncbi:MAG: hypothetical protein ACOC3V_04515 [bacterium]
MKHLFRFLKSLFSKTMVLIFILIIILINSKFSISVNSEKFLDGEVVTLKFNGNKYKATVKDYYLLIYECDALNGVFNVSTQVYEVIYKDEFKEKKILVNENYLEKNINNSELDLYNYE